MAELVEGMEFCTGMVEAVTVLGTKSIDTENKFYKDAYQLGKRLAEEKFDVVSGGGQG
jgi:predicted Rossmann-fold nucleotide-binding protein